MNNTKRNTSKKEVFLFGAGVYNQPQLISTNCYSYLLALRFSLAHLGQL